MCNFSDIDCVWRWTDETHASFSCINCGQIIPYTKSELPCLQKTCSAKRHLLPKPTDSPKSPNLFQKASTFIPAAISHIAQGSPMADETEIERRFNICQGCDKYQKKDEESGACSLCGCSVRLARIFMNKAAWKEGSCPLGKWVSPPTGESNGGT